MNGLDRDNLIKCFNYLKAYSQDIKPLASVYGFLTDNDPDAPRYHLSEDDCDAITDVQKFCKQNMNLFNSYFFPTNYVVNNTVHLNHAITKKNRLDNKHCFYFNYDIPTRMTFIKEFISNCIDNEINFDVAWNEKNGTKDGLIVSVSEEELEDTVGIIGKMSKGNLNYTMTQGLTDIGDKFDWIGYSKSSDCGWLSFGYECADTIESAVAKTMNDYREFVHLKEGNTVNDFAQQLYKASRISKTKDMPKESDFDMEKVYLTIGLRNRYFIDYFNEHAEELYDRYLVNDGFEFTDKPDGVKRSCIAYDTALDLIKTGNNKQLGVVEITPQIVMRTIFACCNFDLPADKKEMFFDDLYNNAKAIAKERHIDYTVPECVSNEFANNNMCM